MKKIIIALIISLFALNMQAQEINLLSDSIVGTNKYMASGDFIFSVTLNEGDLEYLTTPGDSATLVTTPNLVTIIRAFPTGTLRQAYIQSLVSQFTNRRDLLTIKINDAVERKNSLVDRIDEMKAKKTEIISKKNNFTGQL